MSESSSGCLLSRVVLRNYKTIEHCDVRLGPLTFLVGPNGAGKSVFVEALSAAAESLSTGGAPLPAGFSCEISYQLANGRAGVWASDGSPAPKPVAKAISAIAFYNPRPEEMREIQDERKAVVLDRFGRGAAEALFQLNRKDPDRAARVTKYLRRVNPSIRVVQPIRLQRRYNLSFVVGADTRSARVFLADSMSDGTLRALANLVALFQRGGRTPLTLIGLEEPEMCLHPASLGVLVEACREVSKSTQVLVTSHSSELQVPDGMVRLVARDVDGRTVIAQG